MSFFETVKCTLKYEFMIMPVTKNCADFTPYFSLKVQQKRLAAVGIPIPDQFSQSLDSGLENF